MNHFVTPVAMRAGPRGNGHFAALSQVHVAARMAILNRVAGARWAGLDRTVAETVTHSDLRGMAVAAGEDDVVLVCDAAVHYLGMNDRAMEELGHTYVDLAFALYRKRSPWLAAAIESEAATQVAMLELEEAWGNDLEPWQSTFLETYDNLLEAWGSTREAFASGDDLIGCAWVEVAKSTVELLQWMHANAADPILRDRFYAHPTYIQLLKATRSFQDATQALINDDLSKAHYLQKRARRARRQAVWYSLQVHRGVGQRADLNRRIDEALRVLEPINVRAAWIRRADRSAKDIESVRMRERRVEDLFVARVAAIGGRTDWHTALLYQVRIVEEIIGLLEGDTVADDMQPRDHPLWNALTMLRRRNHDVCKSLILEKPVSEAKRFSVEAAQQLVDYVKDGQPKLIVDEKDLGMRLLRNAISSARNAAIIADHLRDDVAADRAAALFMRAAQTQMAAFEKSRNGDDQGHRYWWRTIDTALILEQTAKAALSRDDEVFEVWEGMLALNGRALEVLHRAGTRWISGNAQQTVQAAKNEFNELRAGVSWNPLWGEDLVQAIRQAHRNTWGSAAPYRPYFHNDCVADSEELRRWGDV
jgi:hypothetical protein